MMCLSVIVFLVGLFLVLDYKKPSFFNSSFCTRSDKAMDILRERYARGEITSDEFKIMKETLNNELPPSAFQKS